MNQNRLLRNSVVLAGGVIVGGLLLFTTLVIIARYLTVQRFGQFSIAVTLAAVFQLFADGGIANITVRDLARNQESRARLFGSTLLLAWCITLVLAGVVASVMLWWDPEPALRITGWAMAAAALAGLHGSLHAAVVRSNDDMGAVALIGILHKLLLLALVSVAIAANGGIEGIAFAHLGANIMLWQGFSTLVRLRYLRAPLAFDLTHLRYLVGAAVPLGFGLVLRRMTTYTGTILLAIMAGAVALGYFNAAYRTVQMIEVGTVALTGALLPTFSRLAVQDRVQLNRLCNDSIRLMVVLGGTVGGQLVLFGTPLVKIVFGAQYAPAGPALELLGAALLFLMPSAVMQAMFQAIDRQDVYLKLAFFGLCCMAIMGVVLIPSHAAIGAAIAALVTEILLLLAGAIYLVREGWGLRLLKPLARVLAIVALLAVPIWAGRSWIESAYVLLITALISLAAYISMILFAGIITPKEFRSLWMNRPLREKQSK